MEKHDSSAIREEFKQAYLSTFPTSKIQLIGDGWKSAEFDRMREEFSQKYAYINKKQWAIWAMEFCKEQTENYVEMCGKNVPALPSKEIDNALTRLYKIAMESRDAMSKKELFARIAAILSEHPSVTAEQVVLWTMEIGNREAAKELAKGSN